MTLLLHHTALRRIITIGILGLVFLLTTILLLFLVCLGAIIDLARWLTKRRPMMTLRCLAFGWTYLAGEVWAVVSLGAVTLLGRRRSTLLTYRLQRAWARWNITAVRLAFNLDFDVDGDEETTPGNYILLSRHASLIDTLIPAEYVTRPYDVRLRYVLKSELQLDPALDIAGNRLPNTFIDRGSGESDADKTRIDQLARTMGSDEAILIYPEGTRFSEEKAERVRKRFAGKTTGLATTAMSYRQVLPPRPGGTLTLLEAGDSDVVVLAHHGLEGFARVKDIWAGDLVGRSVKAKFTRITRDSIPVDRNDRVEWLFGVWEDVDAWISQQGD